MERSRWVELEESDCHVDSLVAFGVFKWRRVEINNYFTEILTSFFSSEISQIRLCYMHMGHDRDQNSQWQKLESLLFDYRFTVFTLYFVFYHFRLLKRFRKGEAKNNNNKGAAEKYMGFWKMMIDFLIYYKTINF